ncbi:MAG: hypothetical protein LCH95_05675 [Proteobacteria bacterium]|nr:hypothetical protein [Pseudomonadota bacterium]
MTMATPPSILRIRKRLMAATNRRAYLSEIKGSLSLPTIPALLHCLAQYPYFQDLYAPGARARSYAEMRPSKLLQGYDLERELVWTVSVLRVYEAELSAFVVLERQFLDALLQGSFDTAGAILLAVEQRFGLSGWLLEKRLTLLQEQEGLDAQKRFSFQVRKDSAASPWAHFLAFYHSMRVEPSMTVAGMESFIDSQLAGPNYDVLRQYAKSHFLPEHRPQVDAASTTLFLDGNASIVDRYQAFLRVALLLCTSGPATTALLSNALSLAPINVADYRLQNIIFAVQGCPTALTPPTCSSTLHVFDSYTTGDYETTRDLASKILAESASRADIYELYVKACLQLGLSASELHSNTPLSRLLQAYENILNRTSTYVESVESIRKCVLVFNDIIVTTHVTHLLRREVLRDELTNETEIAASLSSPIGNPWQLTSFRKFHRDPNTPFGLFSECASSPAIQLQSLISLPKDASSCDEVLCHPLFQLLPKPRHDFYKARLLERHGRLEEASALYEQWLGTNYAPLYFDTIFRLTWAKFLQGSYEEVLMLIARTYLRSPFTYASLPVGEVLQKVQELDPPRFATTPALAIVHDIYFRHVSPLFDGERSDAFEDYLTSVNCTRPSQLKDMLVAQHGTAREILLYFLRYLCVPRIMDHSTAFEGTVDLLNERIAVCQLLAETDRPNASAYADEIRVITQELIVNAGVQQVEQSRIHVDTESIRQSIEKPFIESYVRYMQLRETDTSGTFRRIVLHEVGEVVSETTRGILYVPLDERTAFLNVLVRQLGAHFVMNPRHGLNAYLSGRIRHGILPNHLRSPLRLAHLATLRDSRTGEYYPNHHWMNQLDDLDEITRSQLGKRLAQFTQQIDELIDTVNQKWIQIRRPNTPEGLFDFNYRQQDITDLAATIGEPESFDQFLDFLFKFHWDYTEICLAQVRKRIDEELKRRVISAFDELESDLTTLLHGDHYPELHAAIARSRTAMMTTLDTVRGWFRLSKATEKPDFDLTTLVDIAVRSTNLCFRYSPLSPKVSLEVATRLRGASLAHLVELLCLLLSNIIQHSGVLGQAPNVAITVAHTSQKWLGFTITNEVRFAGAKDLEDAQKSIADVKDLLSRNDPSSVLDRHGGTGYARVQKILNHDLKCAHSIDFNLKGTTVFEVCIELDARHLEVST